MLLVDELATPGDLGWLVSGSIARGDAHAHADVDLTRFTAAGPAGYRERYGLRYWEGRLVSVMNRTVEGAQRELESVSGAIWAVEGLRQAKIYAETVILLAERMRPADKAVALEAVARIQREVS